MGERHTLRLVKANLDLAIQGVRAAVRKGGWFMELREKTRTDEQNDALHGLIDQIIKQRPTLNGMKMDKVTYKATFMQAVGHEVTMLPTLYGNGFFPLGLSTSKLTVGEFAQLMEFILAYCAEQGLQVDHFDGRDAAGGSESSKPAAKAA